jgi:hypothetical protein
MSVDLQIKMPEVRISDGYISTFGFSHWTQDRVTPHLSTNAGAQQIAFQDWRKFKEAFAPELVARAATEAGRNLGRPVEICSDPFGGSGTTALACQFLGISAITSEVNPFLADLIEAKLFTYESGQLELAFATLIERARQWEPVADPFPGAPRTFVEPGVNGRFLFWRDIAERIAAYRLAIEELEGEHLRRFFRVMLSSVVVPVSNALVSGKGRRYRRGWELRHATVEQVDFLFADICLKAIYETARHSGRATKDYRLLRGDARTLVSTFGQHDLSVFSPPYPNSFDYTDVYNIELWTLGYLDNGKASRTLRDSTLRSHVQVARSFEGSESASAVLDETVHALKAVRARLWNRWIPEMVNAYFADMRLIIAQLHSQLVERGYIYMVVGDSRYCGVDVPVARVLADEAESLGFEVVASEPFRSMRASPQQGGRLELSETLLKFRKF